RRILAGFLVGAAQSVSRSRPPPRRSQRTGGGRASRGSEPATRPPRSGALHGGSWVSLVAGFEGEEGGPGRPLIACQNGALFLTPYSASVFHASSVVASSGQAATAAGSALVSSNQLSIAFDASRSASAPSLRTTHQYVTGG